MEVSVIIIIIIEGVGRIHGVVGVLQAFIAI